LSTNTPIKIPRIQFYNFYQKLIKITIKWVFKIKIKKYLILDGIPQESIRCIAWSFTIFLYIDYHRSRPLKHLSPLWRIIVGVKNSREINKAG
jgi:hypothetical protein